MPDLATVLDDGYVPLGGAANSLARRLPDCSPDAFMELFKSALFDGAFDDQPDEIGESAIGWLKALPETSKRRYGFTAYSVFILLLAANALPRDPTVRETLLEFDPIAVMRGKRRSYDVLSRTPYKDYPEHGRRELEALMVRRSVLANFLRGRYRVLSLLATDAKPHQQPTLGVPPANENFRRLIEKPSHLRGRPRKAAWPRVVELARQLAREHPDWQKKRLAFETWSRARDEFSESELPSVATLQRSMVEILDG